MAHFFGQLLGNRSLVTKTGHKETGLTARANGWRVGAEVRIQYNPLTDEDEVYFYLTGGSGSPAIKKLIGIWDEHGIEINPNT